MPSTRERPSWDEVWLAVAQDVAERSLCERDRVGAVIVDYRNRIVATGYNNPAEGFQHRDQGCTAWCARAVDGGGDAEYSTCPSLHAEANALMVGERSVREGGTIYVTSHVCFTCAKLIANSGLARVVVEPHFRAAHRPWQSGYTLLENCGIKVEIKNVL